MIDRLSSSMLYLILLDQNYVRIIPAAQPPGQSPVRLSWKVATTGAAGAFRVYSSSCTTARPGGEPRKKCAAPSGAAALATSYPCCPAPSASVLQNCSRPAAARMMPCIATVAIAVGHGMPPRPAPPRQHAVHLPVATSDAVGCESTWVSLVHQDHCDLRLACRRMEFTAMPSPRSLADPSAASLHCRPTPSGHPSPTRPRCLLPESMCSMPVWYPVRRPAPPAVLPWRAAAGGRGAMPLQVAAAAPCQRPSLPWQTCPLMPAPA